MLHVTAVRSPSGLNVNSAVFVAANGFTNSSLIRTSSFGRLSVIVMRPSPTLLLPAHAKTAPVPAAAPSKVFRAAGSSLAHGDHASHLWKSFTWANTAAVRDEHREEPDHERKQRHGDAHVRHGDHRRSDHDDGQPGRG